MAESSPKLIKNGKQANAVVTLVCVDGKKWTVKDFSSRPWYVRKFVGPFMVSREYKALSRVAGMKGVAEEVFKVDELALAIRYVEGSQLDKVDPRRITSEFLISLERLVDALHERGVVHLDLRGSGNILMSPQGEPVIIDFQSSMCTDWMPAFLRKFLGDFDMSGVLKKWKTYRPEEMGDERRKELERINNIRKWWIFKGYGIKIKK